MTAWPEEAFKREACFIDGDWVFADTGEIVSVLDPSTGAAIGHVPFAGRAETARAVAAASRALPDWRARPAADRADLCRAIHDALRDNRDTLARLLTEEMGKPLAEAAGEVDYAASFFRWFAEEAVRVYGEVIPSPWPDRRIVVTRQPVGVVGAITPWNFPTAMIARKVAAALAAGCTIVVKPSELTPFSALAYGVIAERIGLPRGVLNVVTGNAPAIGDVFCQDPAVRKLTFTGSTQVGRHLAAKAMATMTRVSMELGGNAPFVVFEDADLDAAVDGAVAAKYRNAGQTCVCADRLLVHDAVYDDFCNRLAVRAGELVVGPGMEPDTAVGALINNAAVEKVERHIADAVDKGARVLAGGGRHALGGTFFEPTVIADAASHMTVHAEETFAPLAPVFRFHTEEEAVQLANDTEYGLASYVYTRDLARAWRMMEALDYGIVGINTGIISTPVAPFGGMKQSGVGREGSRHGIDDYTEIKYALLGGLA